MWSYQSPNWHFHFWGGNYTLVSDKLTCWQVTVHEQKFPYDYLQAEISLKVGNFKQMFWKPTLCQTVVSSDMYKLTSANLAYNVYVQTTMIHWYVRNQPQKVIVHHAKKEKKSNKLFSLTEKNRLFEPTQLWIRLLFCRVVFLQFLLKFIPCNIPISIPINH